MFCSRYVKFDVPYNHIGFNNQFQDMYVYMSVMNVLPESGRTDLSLNAMTV